MMRNKGKRKHFQEIVRMEERRKVREVIDKRLIRNLEISFFDNLGRGKQWKVFEETDKVRLQRRHLG